jgi:hypothetical protein
MPDRRELPPFHKFAGKPGCLAPELLLMADCDNMAVSRNPFDNVIEVFEKSVYVRRILLITVPSLGLPQSNRESLEYLLSR